MAKQKQNQVVETAQTAKITAVQRQIKHKLILSRKTSQQHLNASWLTPRNVGNEITLGTV